MTDKQVSSFPSYLDNDFFKKCLVNSLDEPDVKIINVASSMGSGVGENYTSFIYRAQVEYVAAIREVQSVSLIIKSIPTDGNRNFLEKIDVFSKEMDMYLKILPCMHSLLNGDQIAPRCFYATKDPIRTIVFEDLKAKGFSLAERQLGLDEKHCQVVLRKIAQFHASSIPVMKQDCCNREIFNQGFFNPEAVKTDIFEAFFRRNLKKAAEMVVNMPGYESFAIRLMSLYENFPKKILESVKYDHGSLNVLNHADLWVNNMMFRHDDGKTPIDVMFVDYQLCYFNSLGLDLNYFFATSSQLCILERKDEFVEHYYYPTFVKVLKTIGILPIPTLDQVLNEMRKRELFGLFNLFGELPLFVLREEDTITNNYAEFTNETVASKTRNAGMSTKRFIDTMKYALKYYDKANVFGETNGI